MATNNCVLLNGDNCAKKSSENCFIPEKSKVTVVLGAQWGDEGKGKVVDMLATNVDVVCRCQVCFNYSSFFCNNIIYTMFFN